MTMQFFNAILAGYMSVRLPREGIFTRLLRHYRHRRQYDHILAQPDRILDDIGLTRAEIHEQLGYFRR